jgi:undecaprenyl-diphosphatase
MTLLQSILLGIIQGATEFLPISSSGHLVLTPNLLGWQIPHQDAFVFDILAQTATTIAVLAYFWGDLLTILRAVFEGLIARKPFENPDARMGWYLCLATIPAGVSYLLFADIFEKTFSQPLIVALFLFGTATLLVLAEVWGGRNRSIESITWKDALLIGCFQVLAIFPGISRSGSTITGGMLRNLNRRSAARFSFLISIPLTLAAGLIGMIELIRLPETRSQIAIFLPGFISAALVGYVAIRWLIQFLTKRPLYSFAIYCVIFGIINLIFVFMQ